MQQSHTITHIEQAATQGSIMYNRTQRTSSNQT